MPLAHFHAHFRFFWFDFWKKSFFKEKMAYQRTRFLRLLPTNYSHHRNDVTMTSWLPCLQSDRPIHAMPFSNTAGGICLAIMTYRKHLFVHNGGSVIFLHGWRRLVTTT
jgi:hypothetical protein